MKLQKLFLAFFTFFCSNAFAAESCAYVATQIPEQLTKLTGVDYVSVSHLRDAYSDEPIVSYSINMANGNIWLAQQKHCEMQNLLVSGAFFSERNIAADDISTMANIMSTFPAWNTHFKGINLLEVLTSELQKHSGQAGVWSLAESMSESDESVEVLLERTLTPDGISPIKSSASLYIGIGGM